MLATREDAPVTNPDDEIRAFIAHVCAVRGGTSWFDRFESAAVVSGTCTLHLDVIAVAPGRPTLVFMPGTNAYALLYGEFLTGIADQGFNIVGFDPRGHGRSTGERGNYTFPELMADMRAAIRYARRRFQGPVFVSGSSQGGIAAFYLAAEGYPIAGAICHNIADLASPASLALTRHPELFGRMKSLVPLLARLLPRWKVPMGMYINMANEPIRGLGSSLDLLRNTPMLVDFIRLRGLDSLGSEPLPCPIEEIHTPVMVLHGGKDQIFPQNYVEALFPRLTCPKEWLLLEDAHHYVLFDEAPRVCGPVAAWMKAQCASAQ